MNALAAMVKACLLLSRASGKDGAGRHGADQCRAVAPGRLMDTRDYAFGIDERMNEAREVYVPAPSLTSRILPSTTASGSSDSFSSFTFILFPFIFSDVRAGCRAALGCAVRGRASGGH